MFVLQGGERMKYKLLKDLYDCFYTPPEFPVQKQEIDECHHALSEVLGKPERRSRQDLCANLFAGSG